jgi:hypothetical protein
VLLKVLAKMGGFGARVCGIGHYLPRARRARVALSLQNYYFAALRLIRIVI